MKIDTYEMTCAFDAKDWAGAIGIIGRHFGVALPDFSGNLVISPVSHTNRALHTWFAGFYYNWDDSHGFRMFEAVYKVGPFARIYPVIGR